MNKYKQALHESMLELAKDERTIFLGQQCLPEDFYGTLKDIPEEKRIEMPVAEEMQLGMSIGMSLEGYLPISIYQRMDFLPRACDQLVNHLDILEEVSQGVFSPHVIIRTTVGTTEPLDTGLQHSKNLVEGFRKLFRNMSVLEVKTPEEVKQAYKFAKEHKKPIMIVEFQELYHKED